MLRKAQAAAERLEALVHDLESTRRAAAGPALERLLAAEKKRPPCKSACALFARVHSR